MNTSANIAVKSGRCALVKKQIYITYFMYIKKESSYAAHYQIIRIFSKLLHFTTFSIEHISSSLSFLEPQSSAL